MIQLFPEYPGFVGFDTWEELNFYEDFMAAKNYAAFALLLPALIQFAEDIHGPKNGKKKLATVTALAQNAILVSSVAGVLDPDVATNTVALTDSIEKQLTKMKERGTLEETGKSQIQP